MANRYLPRLKSWAAWALFLAMSSLVQAAAPTVTTNAATAISATSATLNGTVNPSNRSTTVRFNYGLTTAYGTTVTASPSPLAANSGSAPVTAGVSGLACNATYHFRVVGVNSFGTTNGGDLTFTTAPCVPSVTTSAATSLLATTATLNGLVSSNGASSAVTFDYGLTTGYGSSVTAASSPLGANANNSAVTALVTGLTCNTTYHFRAKGVNTVGTTNGADLTFTTAPCLPMVVTTAATGVAVPGVATLNGTVSANGGSTAVTFEYGLTASYGTSVAAATSPLPAASPANTAVSAALTGLTCGVTYHYRVNGTNSAGTANGNDLTFVTPTCPVALSKTVSTSSDTVGSFVTFTLTARNPNATDLTSVVLTDAIPTDLIYSANAATAGVVVPGQNLVWTIPALLAGTSEQLSLVVKLKTKGTYTNTVTSPGATPASASILVLSNAFVHYRMDETAGSWSGTSKEVIDSGVNGLSGHRLPATATGTNVFTPSPIAQTIAYQFRPDVIGDFCNAGNFDGNAVVESASSTFFQFTDKLSASAWIYPTAYPTGGSDLYSILSNDRNYEFHLNPAGRLFWWWNADSMTSTGVIPLNQWTHIAITLDSSLGNNSRQRIYINGVLDASTKNWSGNLQTNACPFYIGGDITTGAACSLIAARNFRGRIDEAKIYDYELSAAEVQTDMTLGRLCGAVSFDHIRIEHDGTASICSPKTVRVKACLNASCTALYPGEVKMNLSPTGWVGGDSITFSNGVTTAVLNNASISTSGLTLGGAVTGTAKPANTTTRCFNGSTETCTLSVSAPSCAFDAVETGGDPQGRIFTKLAGAAFSIDVLALSNITTINPGYNGTVAVDLVDATSSTCPTGDGLNTATDVAFSNTGRMPVSFNYPNVAKNVRVRAKVGASAPACSSDNFAIRPSAATLVSPDATGAYTYSATAPSAGATPVVKAGTAFDISATTAPSSYAGALAQDASKLTAQSTTIGSAPASGGTVGAFAPSVLTANAAAVNASYSEVGYLYLASGAYRDDGFTNVDQIGQVANCAASNTCDCLLPTSDSSNIDYLSDSLINGRYGCSIGNKATVALGRFIPDHFTVTPGTTAPACSNAFSYFGQDGFATPFTLTAQNAANATTKNYSADFAKLTLTSYASYGFSAATLPAGSELASSATAPTGSWSDGVAGVSAKHQISRPTDITAQTAITVSAAPTDGEVAAGTSAAVGAASNFRYGRLWLGNAYGNEHANLSLPYETQYWNGVAFLKNTLDSCTALNATNVGLGNYQGSVTSANLPLTAITMGSFASGSGTLALAAPNKAGSADVVIRLSPTLGMCPSWVPTGTPTTADYLRGSWCGVTPTFDPFARVTFGISKSSRQIYLRENF